MSNTWSDADRTPVKPSRKKVAQPVPFERHMERLFIGMTILAILAIAGVVLYAILTLLFSGRVGAMIVLGAICAGFVAYVIGFFVDRVSA